MIDAWLASIENADMADWLTVTAYALAAVLAWRAGKRAPRRAKLERWFWQASALALALLGINELLDLQTLLTAIGKAHAQANGWYEGRRQVQYLFIVALTGAALIGAAMALWLTRRMAKPVQVALLGFGFLAVFIVFRAASFHHFDELLGSGWDRFNWGSVQEMIGIAIIGTAALTYGSARSRRRRR